MAWIELHEAVRDHWKIKRLRESSKVRYAEAEGWVVNLWLWAVSNARNGKLEKFTDMEIAEAARCEVEPTKFMQRMMDATLITSAKKINDWKKYGVSKLEKNRKSVEAFRLRKDKLKTHDGNIAVSGTVPYRTVPNRTEPLKSLNVKSVTTTPTTLRARSPQKGTSQEYDKDVVDEIVAFCGDGKSRGYFITACRDFGGGLLREALGELKMRLAEGQSISNRGAYITSLIEDWGKEETRNGR